jgi:nucleolin
MRTFALLASLPVVACFIPHHARMMTPSTVLSMSEPDFDAAAAAPAKEHKIFVANLNYATSDEALKEIFSEFGDVLEANHVNDKFDPSKKRGFGFIKMSSEESCAAAVEALNGAEVDGRAMVVEIAADGPRERTPRAPRPSRGADEVGRKCYIGNLSFQTPDETLTEIFSEFGEVEYCAQITDREDPSRKRGFGFVTFATKDAADAAAENLNGLEVDGRFIKVSIAEPRAF